MAVGPSGDRAPGGGTGAARRAVEIGPDDVLVLRALGLGDALTGVAALRGVRRGWPDRRVVLAGPEELGAWFPRLGLVDAVLPAGGLDPLPDTGPGGHVAVNLHGRGPQSHRLLMRTRPSRLVAFACPEAGHPTGPDDVAPDWRAEEHEVLRWCRLVSAAGGACGPQDLRLPVDGADVGAATSGETGAVLIHPGAASRSRRWPADRWRAVAAHIAAAGHPVVVTGSAGEAGLCAQVIADVPQARSVAGELDVPQLASLVAGARLLLCGDTGVAHLATAVGTPSVLLFGPTPPSAWGPAIDLERHVVLWQGNGRGDPHGDALDPALAAITADEVARAAAVLLTSG